MPATPPKPSPKSFCAPRARKVSTPSPRGPRLPTPVAGRIRRLASYTVPFSSLDRSLLVIVSTRDRPLVFIALPDGFGRMQVASTRTARYGHPSATASGAASTRLLGCSQRVLGPLPSVSLHPLLRDPTATALAVPFRSSPRS